MKSIWASYRVGPASNLCQSMWMWIIGAGLAIFMVGCETYPPAPRAAASSDFQYKIGSLDTINIIVWRNPELSMVVPVRPDGKVTTPLADDIPALGKTPTELAKDIEQALAKYIRDPVVTVVVTTFVGPTDAQIRVVGEAARPQILAFRKNMTLLDVMIAVGGLTDFADGNKASIFRADEGGKSYSVRLQDLGEARRRNGQRRHASRRHPDHSAELVLGSGARRFRIASRHEVIAMDELLQQLIARLRGMWHRRWIGLAVAWIVGIVAVGVALRIPERYEASARVYVDTQSLLRPLMAGLAIQPNLDQQVSLMSRTLISRPNVEKLIHMADMDLRIKSSAEREDLIDTMMKQLQLTGNVTNNLYVISYRNPDPERARNVVQSLLTIFVESSLGDKRLDTRSAMKFVDEQTKQYEESLQAAEDRLKQFKLKYLGITGPAGAGLFLRLSKLKDEIENARLELHAAEQSRDAYKAQVAGSAPVYLPDQAPTIAVPEIDGRITALKTKLDELLRIYTDEHPDVVGTRRVIKQLEEQRAKEVEELQKAAAASGKSGDAADRSQSGLSADEGLACRRRGQRRVPAVEARRL